MKTLILILCALTAGSHAAIVLSDTFTYPDGVLTNVSAGKWRHTTGGGNEVNVDTGRVELTRSETEDVASTLATTYSGGAGTILYSKFSIFVLSPAGGANGNYFAHFDGGADRARVFAVTNGAAAGKFRLGLANGGTVSSVIWPVDLNTNQTYTIVTRHAISNATATLWVDPAYESDTSITAADLVTTASVNTFAWRQDGSMGTLLVDDVVVATSFGEAVTANESPSISVIPPLWIVEGTSTPAIPFTIGDSLTPAGSLIVSAHAANGNLVQSIVFGGTGSNRTVTVTAPSGQSGNTLITLSVTDGTTTNSTSFLLDVIPALLFSDDFSYPAGALITNGAPYWMHHSGNITGQVQVVNGQVVLSSSQTEDVSVVLSSEGPIATNSGVQLYASFRLNFSQLPGSSGDYFIHFNNTSARCRLFANTAGAAAGNFRLGIANGANSVSEQLPTDLATNVSHFVVLRYNLATGVSTLWVNPSAEGDPSTNATDVATANAISTFAFREDPGIGTFTVDDLRIGFTFASVAGAPRLRIFRSGADVIVAWPTAASAFFLQSATSLTLSNWQDVGQSPVVVGSEKFFTNTAPTAPGAFFRLRN